MGVFLRDIKDRSAWETMVLAHSPQALFQSWDWGQVQQAMGVRVLRMGIWQGDDLVGIMQATRVSARRGPFLHIRHGPVFAAGAHGVWDEFAGMVRQFGQRERVWFIRMNPLIADSAENRTRFASLGGVPAAIHRMDGEYCWVLPLDQREEDLLAGMRKSTRYEIRRAQKEGVVVERMTRPADIGAFMELYRKTAARQGFVPHRGIEEEFRIFAAKGNAALYIGSLDGKAVSGALVIFYGNQAVYHHGASVESRIPVSALLQWEAIRDAKKRGLKVYNFWGISPENSPNHPWRGITLFKKGFGGHDVAYIHAYDLPLTPLYVLPRTIEAARRMMKGYD